MRIISGKYKSRIIKRVLLKTTRETSDYIREMIFNVLGDIEGAVLDLFAGSGAYGLEALSRGANRAVFVDNNKEAIRIINANLKLLSEEENSVVLNDDYEKAIAYLKEKAFSFDYLFLDPPYNTRDYQKIIESLFLITKKGSVVVCESLKNIVFENSIRSFSKIKDKIKGNKKVTFYRRLS